MPALAGRGMAPRAGSLSLCVRLRRLVARFLGTHHVVDAGASHCVVQVYVEGVDLDVVGGMRLGEVAQLARLVTERYAGALGRYGAERKDTLAVLSAADMHFVAIEILDPVADALPRYLNRPLGDIHVLNRLFDCRDHINSASSFDADGFHAVIPWYVEDVRISDLEAPGGIDCLGDIGLAEAVLAPLEEFEFLDTGAAQEGPGGETGLRAARDRSERARLTVPADLQHT